ncbi:MAG TPA: AsmA-like C-terminal region-containing protein [Draconibacterium sp.]|nr:AsmA-like C-terminal region-containing protein [Draconibacterium sp.]
MKRLYIILLLILAFALVILLGAPFFLKPTLRGVASNSLKKYFNGTVEIARVDVSVWKDFPKLDIEWKDILVKGNEPDQNDTLLWIGTMHTNTPIRAIFLPSDMEITSLEVDGVNLNLDENSFAKRKPQKEIQKQTAAIIAAGSNKSVHLQLHQMTLKNADLKYTVQKSGVVVSLGGINADLSGELFGKESSLSLNLQAEEFNIRQNDRQLFPGSKLAFKTQLATDFDKKTVQLNDGQIDFDEIPFLVNGSVSSSRDSVYFDLDLKGKETGFADFIALFPNLNQKLFKNFSMQGTAELKGKVSGFYFGNEYPAINFSATVSGASLQYSGMPGSIDKLQASLALTKPQGAFDSTRITISEAHAEMGKNPLDFNLKILQPFSDPVFDGILIGKINLMDLQNIYPMDDVLLYGDVDANLVVQGKYSDLRSKDYSKIKSDGVVWLHNFRYSSPKLTQQISVPEAKLNISPEKVKLQQLALQIGQSDFLMKGVVRNHLNYLLNKGTLEADLQLDSRFINLNQLFLLKNVEAGLSASIAAAPAPDDENIAAFEVPSRVNLKFRSNVEHALLLQIPMEKVRGSILVENQKLILQDLSINMLDGSLKMNGSYENTEQRQPLFDFGFQVKGFDIPTMARTLDGFRQLVPGSENSTGSINAELRLKGRFNEKLKLISETANGSGTFSTKNLVIINSPLFKQLGGIIKKERLQRVDVSDFTAHLQIEKGNIQLLPFETRVIGQPTKVSGNLSAENILDMQLDFMVDRDVIGSDIQKILAVIPGNEKIKQLPASVKIDGPSKNPKVHPDLSVTTQAVVDATKDDLKNSMKNIFKLFK